MDKFLSAIANTYTSKSPSKELSPIISKPTKAKTHKAKYSPKFKYF